MNLLCTAGQAGSQVAIHGNPKATQEVSARLNCGKGVPVRIPYYILGLLMVGTMFFQQRQMQKAAPPGASQQQQALTRIMPLLSIFWGFIVPSGVILYWTTSNAVQIGQQYFLLRAGKIGPGAISGDGARSAPAATSTKAAVVRSTAPARRGFFASMLERAETDRARRLGQQAPAKPQPKTEGKGDSTAAPAATTNQAKAQSPPQRRPGGQGARSRKKRRKR